MECARAQEILWPPEEPRLAGELVVEARAHVDACASCRSLFESDRALDRVRQTVVVPVPTALRERVFDSLAARRTGRRSFVGRLGARRMSVRIGSVLLISAALGGLLVWVGGTGRSAAGDDAAAFVDDYVRRAVSADRIDSSDPAEVARFLTRELGTPLQPLHTTGLALVGAEICLIDGRRGALVRYRRGDQSITHYVVPGDGAATRAPTRARSRAGAAGLAVVIWSTGAFDHALVADVPADTLIALAHRPRPE
jgi:hypothetical protein